jgi:transcriptional regulator with XRE-family HTH domain
MESLMKIDVAKVKALREQRSWSQDHLAEVSALSVRTIQRVEAEGACSSETRMALAAAFGIAAAELLPMQPVAATATFPWRRIGLICGSLGLAVGTIGAAIGIMNGANSGGEVGVGFGMLGMFAGLCGALMGIAYRKMYPPNLRA